MVPHIIRPGSPILLLGEAPGRTEVEQNRPFAGASGAMLEHFLRLAKIPMNDCSLANVFNTRPEDNKVLNFCGPNWKGNPLPYLERGHYVAETHLADLDVLSETLATVRPNLIVGLGNTACWAMLHKTGIGQLRGYATTALGNYKFLPTYHPAAVMRNHKLFPTVAEDFIKAKRLSGPGALSRPSRTICIAQTLAEAQNFWQKYGGPRYACDIETKNQEITCLGFAARPTHALVIPFTDPSRPGNRWWSTYELELQAWRFVESILSSGTAIFHNGSYDLSYLVLRHKIRILANIEDTMVMHHALEPEIQKSLGHLGSIFTDEPAWKLMRLQVDYKKDDK